MSANTEHNQSPNDPKWTLITSSQDHLSTKSERAHTGEIDKVYLALGVTNLRKSIDGLSLIVSESFNLDPFSRNLYFFCNRKKDKIKIFEWDRSSYWLQYKQLKKDEEFIISGLFDFKKMV